MSSNPGQPLLLRDRLRQVADEQYTGGHFEGESKRERRVGHDQMVVVDIIKRNPNPYLIQPEKQGTRPGTYFMRVSLRCPIDPKYITRYEIDIDRYATERELCAEAFKGGGLVATAQIENRGAKWDPNFVATQAAEACKELLREIADPDKVSGI